MLKVRDGGISSYLGLGFSVEGLGFLGLGFVGLGFRVLGLRVQGFRDKGLRWSKANGLGFK